MARARLYKQSTTAAKCLCGTRSNNQMPGRSTDLPKQIMGQKSMNSWAMLGILVARTVNQTKPIQRGRENVWTF